MTGVVSSRNTPQSNTLQPTQQNSIYNKYSLIHDDNNYHYQRNVTNCNNQIINMFQILIRCPWCFANYCRPKCISCNGGQNGINTMISWIPFNNNNQSRYYHKSKTFEFFRVRPPDPCPVIGWPKPAPRARPCLRMLACVSAPWEG